MGGWVGGWVKFLLVSYCLSQTAAVPQEEEEEEEEERRKEEEGQG